MKSPSRNEPFEKNKCSSKFKSDFIEIDLNILSTQLFLLHKKKVLDVTSVCNNGEKIMEKRLKKNLTCA